MNESFVTVSADEELVQQLIFEILEHDSASLKIMTNMTTTMARLIHMTARSIEAQDTIIDHVTMNLRRLLQAYNAQQDAPNDKSRRPASTSH